MPPGQRTQDTKIPSAVSLETDDSAKAARSARVSRRPSIIVFGLAPETYFRLLSSSAHACGTPESIALPPGIIAQPPFSTNAACSQELASAVGGVAPAQGHAADDKRRFCRGGGLPAPGDRGCREPGRKIPRAPPDDVIFGLPCAGHRKSRDGRTTAARLRSQAADRPSDGLARPMAGAGS